MSKCWEEAWQKKNKFVYYLKLELDIVVSLQEASCFQMCMYEREAELELKSLDKVCLLIRAF